jgi:hypothetical protein
LLLLWFDYRLIPVAVADGRPTAIVEGLSRRKTRGTPRLMRLITGRTEHRAVVLALAVVVELFERIAADGALQINVLLLILDL